jgi:hypothetical protein
MKITRCAVDLVLFAGSAVREVAVEHGAGQAADSK